MRFIIDIIIALTFWSFTIYSVGEVYQYFSEASVKQVEQGLNSTVRFTESLLDQ